MLDDIEDRTGAEPDSVFTSQEDFGWVNDSCSEVSAVNRSERIGNLHHVAP